MSAPSTSESSAAPCRNCNAPTNGAHFCASCGKIQPLSPGTDYFAFFGLPRKLLLDTTLLEQRFHQLSWKLHPDNFVNATESERELSLDRSSQLNDAYRTLRELLRRVEYLLGIEGMRNEGASKQQAPPELLDEVFALNESLDELREANARGGNTSAIRARLAEAHINFEKKRSEIDEQLRALCAQWDQALDGDADRAARMKLMTQMNELLNRRSYIRNLVAGVQKELVEA
ncbi:MAG TPA: Fe-S protein assembly co-chaperone HscB [Candidatus Dormibacteraeota bacterium]|nr:Fe-S protein assembly co-chaperone HscB [Candidatus Dormibacteraeota bacterium]